MQLFSGIQFLAATEEPSLFRELWDYFVDKYFTVRFEEYNYQHLNVSGGGLLSVRAVVVALFLGIIIASAVSMFQKRTLGDLVRALDREDANTPERAKTLEELGLRRASAIKQDLRRGTALRRVVRCVEEENYHASMAEKKAAFEADEANQGKKWKDIPYKINFETDHFYVPEEKMFGAVTHFSKKGSNPLVFAFTVVACLIFMAVVCWLVPEMLMMADNFVGVFTG